jgi:hypothetical protein
MNRKSLLFGHARIVRQRTLGVENGSADPASRRGLWTPELQDPDRIEYGPDIDTVRIALSCVTVAFLTTARRRNSFVG